jgi:hypothetical protein
MVVSTTSTMATTVNHSRVRCKDLDTGNGVQQPRDGGKTADSAQNSGSGFKLAATLLNNREQAVDPPRRRASVSEEITTLKRKGMDLDRYVARLSLLNESESK